MSAQKCDEKPILCLYTDGGPDHNTTFLATKIALINLFLEKDLDMLVAVRTPPYHSWKNPVERVMSIVNIALQAVGLMRCSMTEDLERSISSCQSVKQIREACEAQPLLRNALIDAMEPTKLLLESLFVRLKLKEHIFEVFHAASSAELDSFWNHILRIDTRLTRQDSSKAILEERPGLKFFLQHCCQERAYSFSIKKCGEATCSICTPPRLPPEIFSSLHHLPDPVPDSTGEHYKNFEDLYGTFTTEKFRPTLLKGSKKSHGLPFQPNAQFARNVCVTIQCCECLKPRVLYSQRKLKYPEEVLLQNLLCDVMYSCGSQLSDLVCDDTPPSHRDLLQRVFVLGNLTCSAQVETAYYSSQVFENICVHCGKPDGLVRGEEAVDVVPTCELCFKHLPKVFKRKRSQVKTATCTKKSRQA